MTIRPLHRFFSLPRPLGRPALFFIIVALLLLQSGAVFAQVSDAESGGKLRATLNRPQYKFSQNDYVHLRIDSSIKSTYFVGEPVAIPIVLSNHTDYPITISTNFIPRSQLHVQIMQVGQPSRAYNGPFKPYTYSMVDLFLYPLEEYRHTFVMWSDPNEPGGVAFFEPGDYSIELALDLTVAEGGQPGRFEIGTIDIHVVPTPAQLKPFVDAMMTKNDLLPDGAAIYFHNRNLPPNWEKNALDFLQLPPNPLTPYVGLGYAAFLENQWRAMKDQNPKLAQKVADSVSFYYSGAALSDSAYQLDAYNSWIRFLDASGDAAGAVMIAQKYLQVIPRDRLGKLGNSPTLKKYLINTTEIDPMKYWPLLQ